MSDAVDIVIDETVEQIDIQITEDTAVVDLSTTETKEEIKIEVVEGKYIKDNVWINLASGWDVVPFALTTTLPGKVYSYTYKDASTYYRYIATDGSIDAFYENFTDPTLSGLIVTRRI